jgi:hypothetical protein
MRRLSQRKATASGRSLAMSVGGGPGGAPADEKKEAQSRLQLAASAVGIDEMYGISSIWVSITMLK